MTAGERDRELGPDRVLIGHDWRQEWPEPSGWRVLCECGDILRGITRGQANDRWHAHWDEERENAGLP